MATHCATRESDMDICICASYSGPYQSSPAFILQAIYEDLQHNHHAKEYFGLEGVSDLVFISTAKVPILKFKMNGVEVDMSVSFDIISPPKSVLAARLINAYCQLDERFTILVIFLKSWMKSELSNTDFMRDFPNSYSLILMLIHVLQWHGIMPNLHETHPHLFDFEWKEESMYPLEWTDVIAHQQRSTNTLSVAQLLHIFSTQYSNNIIINCCKLDMGSGMLETRGERDNAPIFIQDVFDTRNPARSVRGNEMVQALQCVSKLFSNPKNLLFQRIWRVTRMKTYLLPR
ncbi:hypothetical protein GCK72_011074 [Caenorhabditis remanei]|uniref:Poly(A) RNA polymerase mitochondrial-like central palm domain-containing protein n=1 Tax=Caenorhabditis remanei TaxID=31234 RepID=A0A6A5H7F5_CAERE|nr:hypothetical protein GCK72_011074 [Caenorhabditis remanei]KAF1762811.1 hypothetical protein GCK72_011074 [Caenorhabditis remanei]